MKMAEVTVTINGKKVSGSEGISIFDLAKENGIEIPTLCYLSELPAFGACRICVVEVEGSRTLVGSCHTPAAEGMVIHTHSPKVLQTRKIIVELLLSSHCGTCYMCEQANACEFRLVVADLEVGLPRFQTKTRFYPLEDSSTDIQRDLNKCILCLRCLRACRDIAGKSVFAKAYRGFNSKIVVDMDQPLDKEVCKDCDVCVSICPTGALTKPRKLGEEKKGSVLFVSD